MKVVAFVPDLMDRSRFKDAQEVVDLEFASAMSSLTSVQADLVVADLSRPGIIEVLRGVETPKVGFFSHVDDATRADAVAAGVRVYARSAFFSRLVSIITKSGEATTDRSD